MPDSYWDAFGSKLKAQRYTCIECGRNAESLDMSNVCPMCWKPELPEKVKCVTCGEEFMPVRFRNKGKRCPDCVGERSETRPPQFGEKVRDGYSMRKDDDP